MNMVDKPPGLNRTYERIIYLFQLVLYFPPGPRGRLAVLYQPSELETC